MIGECVEEVSHARGSAAAAAALTRRAARVPPCCGLPCCVGDKKTAIGGMQQPPAAVAGYCCLLLLAAANTCGAGGGRRRPRVGAPCLALRHRSTPQLPPAPPATYATPFDLRPFALHRRTDPCLPLALLHTVTEYTFSSSATIDKGRMRVYTRHAAHSMRETG